MSWLVFTRAHGRWAAWPPDNPAVLPRGSGARRLLGTRLEELEGVIAIDRVHHLRGLPRLHN